MISLTPIVIAIVIVIVILTMIVIVMRTKRQDLSVCSWCLHSICDHISPHCTHFTPGNALHGRTPLIIVGKNDFDSGNWISQSIFPES